MIKKAIDIIKRSLLDEVSNLFLLTPVFVALGIHIYFKYFFKSFFIQPIYICIVFAYLSAICRKKHYLNLINIAIFLFTLGFSLIQIEAISKHSLAISERKVEAYVEGRVKQVKQKTNSTSIIVNLNQESIQDIPNSPLIGIKNVSVKITSKSEIPQVNDEIYLKAILNPPTPPAMKGAYNFARASYFDEIGATGYAISRLYFINKNPQTSPLQKVKNKIKTDTKKYSSNNDNYTLINSFMLGEKKSITKKAKDLFRHSGISHLLSISGLHIYLIFGFIFYFFRYLFSISETITLNINIKKIAAFISIISTLLYIILIGFPLPAIRSFIMIFIVLLGILFDRRAISMRSIAIAATVILLIYPESLISVSFQMSFAAVTALVAFYEFIKNNNKLRSKGAKRYILGIITTSIIATLATSPISIYHFQNLTPYGVITNLLVIPLVSFILMPSIILSYILIPFKLSFITLSLSDKVMSIIMDIANYITNLEHSYIIVAKQSELSFTIFILGGLFACLFKEKIRIIGIIMLFTSLLLSFIHTDKPDIIISPFADIIAIRRSDNKLTFSSTRKHSFTSNIIAHINGQTEILPFSENNLIKCNNHKCYYTKNNISIDIESLKGKRYAQQIYIKNDVVETKAIK
ncbi:MAG: ComEC/Rec2 family competence protein [Alphaproteobacteria bacterium]|jgi:competence protein ComEC|nr:ComEC/Rec2 family competence protein [Alphaproteobacteria bacterium]MCV6599864.1 ComEC/Rec2 family competence protein [Alphaproteobacteria bacterium]